jgi:hypothetical protein
MRVELRDKILTANSLESSECQVWAQEFLAICLVLF